MHARMCDTYCKQSGVTLLAKVHLGPLVSDSAGERPRQHTASALCPSSNGDKRPSE